jgi:hypothetical protein
MQIVASVATYPELRDALGDRRLEHGLTQIELDYLSGVQDGWTGKAECSAKRWGQMSLACALGALGLRIVLVEDEGGIPRQTAEMAAMSRRRPAKPQPAALATPDATIPAPDPAPAPAPDTLEAA